MSHSVEKKLLSCLFWLDVLCSYRRRYEKLGIMDRCLKCPHYFRFLREMDKEDQKVMDEVDEIRRTGVYK